MKQVTVAAMKMESKPLGLSCMPMNQSTALDSEYYLQRSQNETVTARMNEND